MNSQSIGEPIWNAIRRELNGVGPSPLLLDNPEEFSPF